MTDNINRFDVQDKIDEINDLEIIDREIERTKQKLKYLEEKIIENEFLKMDEKNAKEYINSKYGQDANEYKKKFEEFYEFIENKEEYKQLQKEINNLTKIKENLIVKTNINEKDIKKIEIEDIPDEVKLPEIKIENIQEVEVEEIEELPKVEVEDIPEIVKLEVNRNVEQTFTIETEPKPKELFANFVDISNDTKNISDKAELESIDINFEEITKENINSKEVSKIISGVKTPEKPIIGEITKKYAESIKNALNTKRERY